MNEVDSLGKLGDHNKWFIICKNCSVRERLLKINQLSVGDQLFNISEPYQHTKLIRLMNIPPTVSDADIRTIVSKWGGTILSIENEKVSHPYENNTDAVIKGYISNFKQAIKVNSCCPDYKRLEH